MKWTNLNNAPNNYQNKIEALRNQTPYQRLGITTNATLQDAKKAYKEKVRLYHPDRTDDFMAAYCSEVVKLLNDAIKRIKKVHEQ